MNTTLLRDLIERAIPIIEQERDVLFEGHQVNGVVKIGDEVDQVSVDAMADMDAWLAEARVALTHPVEATTAPEKWAIDRSTESPILTYENCSVIQDEQAFFVLELVHQAAARELALKPTHRHKKRGTGYILLGMGRMQAGRWFDLLTHNGVLEAKTSVDMCEVAIYRSVDDGSLWVRPREEFEDGRFETLPSKLDRTEQFLLEWLGKEDSSAYGECRGVTLDALVARGYVSIKPARDGQGENYARVSLTEVGRLALA